jgi:2Fe-2S ferredoxin
MPNVTYVQPDGLRLVVDVPTGTSLMLGAVQNNVRGIYADCGGCASCATCHVYVDEAFADRIVQPTETELELLTGVAAERRANSRLCCQIEAAPELEGLVITIPEKQA